MEVLKRRSCFQAIVKWGTLLVSLGWSVIHNSKLSGFCLFSDDRLIWYIKLLSYWFWCHSISTIPVISWSWIKSSYRARRFSSLWRFLPRFSSLLRLRCLLFGMGLCRCFCSKPVSYQPSTFCLSRFVDFSCTLCWFLSALSFRPSVSRLHSCS